MNAQEIRQQFIDFFESKQHKIVPSAPMVLKDDPTLMFTNAGMVPFKEFFLGQSKIVNTPSVLIAIHIINQSESLAKLQSTFLFVVARVISLGTANTGNINMPLVLQVPKKVLLVLPFHV